jgi:pyrimidine-nucleoside phosphorylase
LTDFIGIIEKKRDGGENTAGEIGELVSGYLAGSLPEYQMSAWLMAAFLRGLSLAETLALTGAIIDSGRRLDLSRLGVPVLDKHSTGGVGDKVSMVLGPLVAACGGVFGKMSGRGLGHTGGTVDKLESIPGFQTMLSPERFISQLEETGICIAGQSAELAPADDRLYALREVTATIDSNALTAASIMSKKVAAGAAVVVLDVKVGRGAFFKNRGQAAGVAHLMRRIGGHYGLKVETVMSAMDQPLGHAVGNALEVNEAVKTLAGEGPADLVEVVTELAARLLERAGLFTGYEPALEEARKRLGNGDALERFGRWVEAQGGDGSFIHNPGLLPVADIRRQVIAAGSGFVAGLDALAVGKAVLDLGAGRREKGAEVDHGVGATVHAKVGDRVEKGQELATVYARSEDGAAAAADRIDSAYSISKKAVSPPPVLLAVDDG